MPARTVLYVAAASKIGGGNKVLIDLIQNLDPTRYRAHVVSPHTGPLVEWAQTHGVESSVCAPGDWESRTGTARRAVALAATIVRTRADIVHAATPVCYRALGIAALGTGARRVCHLGFPPSEEELARAFIAGPDVVIGCYRGQAIENAATIARLKPRCRIVGIPNGVDIRAFSTTPAAPDVLAIRRSWKLAVAILGHISEVKGYGAFIEAARRVAISHPDCGFVAIGGETTEPGAFSRFESRVKELGLSDRFVFLGLRSDVAAVLQAIDIVCLPSLAEGFPLAVLEAMAGGKPVVATTVGGVPEAVVHEQTGLLIEPNQPELLTQAIETLAASEALRRQLGDAGRTRIREQYSIGGFASAVQGVYDDLMGVRQQQLQRVLL